MGQMTADHRTIAARRRPEKPSARLENVLVLLWIIGVCGTLLGGGLYLHRPSVGILASGLLGFCLMPLCLFVLLHWWLRSSGHHAALTAQQHGVLCGGGSALW